MRIALVVPGGVDRSGEYRVIPAVLALLTRLSQQHDVQVIALRQEDVAGEWQLAGAQIHNIGMPHPGWRALFKIMALHRAAPLQLVHALWSGTAGLVTALAGHMLGIPSLVHVTGGELIWLPEIGYGLAGTWRGRLRERLVLRSVSAVTTSSTPLIAALARLGVKGQRISLGVDRTTWPVRTPVPRTPGRSARLIHVASLNRVKDQAMLLRALQRLRQANVPFELDLVGEDTLGGEIQRLAQELGLSACIRFHGFLTQRALRPLIEAADLMVHTSRHEAGPFVMLEAAVVGVPTIGTAVGHLTEWAPAAAMSVPIGDDAALAAAIQRLMGDEALRLDIASEAQRRAILEDADYTAQRFNDLYAQIS